MQGRFGRTLTLGVEEELFLLDARTFAPAPGVERLLGPEGLKTELFACLVETNTPVCESAAEALAELGRLRGVVARRAAAAGLVSAAVGTHPFALASEQAIVPEPRYLKLQEELGPDVKRQLVCGLHVHVGMPSFDACLRALGAVVPWLPEVLALSLNSPYLEGEETPSLSARAGRLLELPRGGMPPALSTPPEWQAVVAATGEDYTRSWWDARPHPRLGTLEIRIADQQTDVRRSAALAALLQALCAAAEPPPRPLDEDEYLRRRDDATRGIARVGDLLELVEPAARSFGSWELITLLGEPPEAHRQLATGRRAGLAAVAAELAFG